MISVSSGQPLSHEHQASALSLQSIRESQVLATTPAAATGSAAVGNLLPKLNALTIHSGTSNLASARRARAVRRAHHTFTTNLTNTGYAASTKGGSNTPPLGPKTVYVREKPNANAPSASLPPSPSPSSSPDESPAAASASAGTFPLPAALILHTVETGSRKGSGELVLPATGCDAQPSHSPSSSSPGQSPLRARVGVAINLAAFVNSGQHNPTPGRRHNPYKQATFTKQNLLKYSESATGCCSSGSPASNYVIRKDPNLFVLDPANADVGEIVIDNCDINAGTFEELEHLRHLSHLTIRNCPQFTDAMIIGRTNLLRRLRKIDFSNTGITNLTLTALRANCPALQTLCLANTQISDLSALSVIAPNGNIRALDPNTLNSMSRLGNVHTLDISNCSRIEEGQLAHLTAEKCKNLKTLKMSGCTLSDEGLQHLAKSRIRTLHAEQCQPAVRAASFLPTCLGGHSASRRAITLDGMTALAAQQPFLKMIHVDGAVTDLSQADIRNINTLLWNKTVREDLPNERGAKVADGVVQKHRRNRVTLSASRTKELLHAAKAELPPTATAGSSASGGSAAQALPPAPQLHAAGIACASPIQPPPASVTGLTPENFVELARIARNDIKADS